MAVPALCRYCGLLFNSNAVGGPDDGLANIEITGSTTTCPRCGSMASIDGNFLLGRDYTVVLSAPWLMEFENRLRLQGISRGQAKRIQKKISKAKDPRLLSDSVRPISQEVAQAVEVVLKQNTSDEDKWQWLYRIAAVVGIVAGLNTLSEDYNIDAAIEWIKSQNAQSQSSAAPQEEAVSKPPKDSFRGPM